MSRLVIEAGRTRRRYWTDLWRFRELFFILAWRDIAVRYKQTAVGVAWAVVRPLLTMAVFTVVFGVLGKFPSDGLPYPLLVFAALLPWQFFSSALSEASASLVENEKLISKVYFPRLVIPASSVIVSLADFLVSFVLLVGVMAWFQVMPTWRFATIPLFVGIAFLAALGPGLLITALNVEFRDFRYVIPFIIQVGLYASPVGYPSSMVPEKWRLLYSINPMVGVIDGFRWAIGGTGSLYLPGFAVSMVLLVGFLWLGISYFRRMERTFADVI